MMFKKILVSLALITFPLICVSDTPETRGVQPGKVYYLNAVVKNKANALAEFNAFIQNKNVVVDFFATWCNPCTAFAPHFESVAREFSDLIFLKVDTDEYPSIARQCGVRSIPFLVCFKNGVLAASFSGGGLTRATLKGKLASLFD